MYRSRLESIPVNIDALFKVTNLALGIYVVRSRRSNAKHYNGR